MMRNEFFGSDQQRAILRRGRGMAALLERDTRFSFSGRTVGLTSPEDGDIDQLATLVMLQGNANYGSVPSHQVEAIKSGLGARGLATLQYDKWEATGSVVATARQVVATISLPKDLTLVRVEASTPDHVMASMAQMALDCGVLPPCGEVLRGLYRPAVCLVAMDREANVVACAASCAFAHLEHARYGRQAFWGMLATHPDRRGHRLSLILGAHVLLDMEARFGFRSFMTGVEPGNVASEAICARIGLSREGFAIIACTDTQALTGGRMTK